MHSHTFHGRDILAPVAAMLACGEPPQTLGIPIDNPILLDVAPVGNGTPAGRIIQIDQFGNATTNIPYEFVRRRTKLEVRVKGRKIGRLKRTYWDVAPGKPVALIGSSGLLEIAVRDGSAEKDLKMSVGDEVTLR
jgi:S-adenosylmethionine hydrolase